MRQQVSIIPNLGSDRLIRPHWIGRKLNTNRPIWPSRELLKSGGREQIELLFQCFKLLIGFLELRIPVMNDLWCGILERLL